MTDTHNKIPNVYLVTFSIFANLEGFLINIMSRIKYVKLGGTEFKVSSKAHTSFSYLLNHITMKMSFVLVFTFGLAIILSKTGVEGRRLEENPLDQSLRGVQGKEYVLADNKVVFSSSGAGGSNKEEAKKDINSTPGEKKAKAAADASAGYSFGARKDAENEKMVDRDRANSSLSTMKIPFALVLTFGLVMIISKTSVEGRRLEENPLDFSLRGVKGKDCMLDHNKVVFGSTIGGRSNEEIKKNIKSTGEKKGKAAVDPSFGYPFGATKNADDNNSNNNAKNNKYDGDPFAHTLGMSADSHHQVSIDEYRRMFGDLPKHP
ncbi:hypothetical protein MUK42_18174 [Musa troglodytarum]|uniref:Uncharacterized protein n=2 Tax=Musa troglodytarum TaxID=320322 RepID=A0A9E7H8M2_9LILI|nr:hypothetical protein MUK42_18174 [Musa troglodytarum]